MTPIEGWTEVAASTMTVTSSDFISILIATILLSVHEVLCLC